jgi:pyruvate dehydrogenase E1 component alpha subunit
MNLSELLARDIYQRADLCRQFEVEVFKQVESKNIQLPVYLSAGQEYIAATLSVALEHLGIVNRQVFIQHRGHSTYLCFGGDIDGLILELLGRVGCANGMGGSASIHSKEANIFGHDGLMGSHGPIAVGMAYSNKVPTLCFTGDAAAEEDYFLAAIGWASTKNLPMLFVVEDNNLSILTEKKVRRNWEMHEIARGFRMNAYDIEDCPEAIFESLDEHLFETPLLLNIRTNRLFWHAGAGIDSHDTLDRHLIFGERFTEDFRIETREKNSDILRSAWKRHL